MAKTLAVIGAGPGVGMAVARKFGREGFRTALVARSKDSLDGYVSRLTAAGIEAAGFPADVLDRPGLADALARVKDQFGPIDAIEYSPTPTADSAHIPPRDITLEHVQHQFDYAVGGAMTAVREVLPDMLARGDGAFLFCSAASAKVPLTFSSPFGIANAGLLAYAHVLNQDLASAGIYAGILMIAGIVDKGDVDDPERAKTQEGAPNLAVVPAGKIADLFWDMYVKRDRVEEMVGDLDVVLRMIEAARAGQSG